MANSNQPILAVTLLALGGLAGCKGSKSESQMATAKSVVSPVEKRSNSCAEIQATGTQRGQVAPNVALRDGDGKVVNLHDYCDKTVLLIAGTMF